MSTHLAQSHGSQRALAPRSLIFGLSLVLAGCGGGGGSSSSLVASMLEDAGGNTLSVNGIGKLSIPQSGITADQCYRAGSDVPVSCDDPRAIELNSYQDGMLNSIAPLSYSQLGSFPITSCVKDNVTGLIWEGKKGIEPYDIRGVNRSFTNFDSSTVPQKYYWNGYDLIKEPPSEDEIKHTSNSIGYVNAINEMALCGFKDWRLPTREELLTLMDYSKTGSQLTIDTTWFPNTRVGLYWTSTPVFGNSFDGWHIQSNSGWAYDFSSRQSRTGVRLVRASP